jgi:mRNA interferase MazF
MLNDGGEIRRKRQWMTSDEERYSISHEGGATNGSEQFADRPAVVVSNDENNKHSGAIEVVYMTTQPKTDLPTHVTVRSTGRLSTVLCEQVSSVSTDRVNNYIGQVSEQEMKNIDIALMISLQLSGGGKTSKQYNETIQKQQEEIEYYRNKIQAMQQSLEEKKTEKPQEAAGETSEIVVRLETERDTYKALYEQLFERMLNGGTGK